MTRKTPTEDGIEVTPLPEEVDAPLVSQFTGDVGRFPLLPVKPVAKKKRPAAKVKRPRARKV